LAEPKPCIYILGLVKGVQGILKLMSIYMEATDIQEQIGNGILIRRSFLPVYGQLPKLLF
jgi:hypothetical protein